MKIPNLKEMQWFSPPDLGGENISSIMRRYIEFMGWKIGDNPALIYAGSESQLEKGIEAKKKFPDIPFLLNFWGWLPTRLTDLGWRTHYLKRLDLIEKYVDAIIVPNSQTMEQLQNLGINGEIVIYPPGVDTISLIISKIESKRYLQGDDFVISVGRLVPHKNFQEVIVALKGTEFKYIIIGKGESKDALLSLADQNGVKVHIVEDADDKMKGELIALAKVLVVPSAYEGFGLPIIEGITIGTPVIASNLATFTDLFGDNLEYYYDTADLKNKICNSIENNQYRKNLIQKEALLALKYSAFTQSAYLNHYFTEKTANFLKDKMKVEYINNRNTLEEAYNLDALIDKTYFRYRLDPNNSLFFFRAEPLLKNLSGKTVLDVGSSTGIFALYMAKQGFKVTSIDISQEYLSITESLAISNGLKESIDLKKCDATNLKGIFEDNTFDNVWAGEIIEHCENSEDFIKELLRVVKIKGRVLLTVPYQDACYDAFHLHIFNTEEDIRSIFKNYPNFEIKEIKKIGSPGGGHKNWFAWGIKNE